MILTYHSIGKPVTEVGNELYCVTLERFKEQIDFIRDCPRRGLSLQITFDDGDISNHKHVYPILKEKGMTAYFFILVGKVGESGYMNWQQIKELRAAGMTIGSHGMTHRILTVLSDQELERELKDSKKILEQQLGSEIKYFSIPRGFYNKKVIKKTKEAGYQTVFTSNFSDKVGFLFGRVAVKASWDIDYFTGVINRGYSLKDRIGEWLKDCCKTILGANTYDGMRRKVLK